MKNREQINPYIQKLTDISCNNNNIVADMYAANNVKRGLRDENGNGVITGLTEISDVISKKKLPDGTVVPCEGELYYRGVNIKDFTADFLKDDRFGYEEAVYLLLFSELPNKNELDKFKRTLSELRSLPQSFTNTVIYNLPSKSIMNSMAKSVLSLYPYDDYADDVTLTNVVRQCLYLISVFPLLASYGYAAYENAFFRKPRHYRGVNEEFSTAEIILSILRDGNDFTHTEAKVLDLALVLHAEHGGGNNSSFTTHVVTSSGTDTYSAIAAALGSLKGPRHGGANIKVVQMFEDMKANINTKDKGQIKDYLVKLLDKEAFDKSGLIYGLGHAVYSVSDPRADILKKCAKELSVEKGYDGEFELYTTVANLAPEVIAEKRKIYKGVSPNVDFYSGMVYRMLDLPPEIFTPIFAVSRIAGWSAHRIEEIQNAGKIIRPAYVNVKDKIAYKPLNDRV